MKKFGFIIGVTTFLFGLALDVTADTTKIKPYLFVTQEYSDNILFTQNNEAEDFITTLSGGIALMKTTEILDAGVEVRLDQLFYHDFNELDSLDKLVKGHVDYKATERLGIGASARYSEDSQRDRETDTTGLVISGEREKADFSVSSDYFFSEILQGEVSLGYGMEDIDETNRTEDNDDISLNISFSKNLSKTFKNTTALLRFNYLQYTSDIETITSGAVTTATTFEEYVSDIFQVSAGFSKDITELYNIYCLVGVSYTTTDEELRILQTFTAGGAVVSDNLLPKEEYDKWGGVISAGLNYDGLYYDMGLSISSDMRGSSGTNGAVQRYSVSGNISRKVTDKFRLSLDASCYLNQNDRTNEADTDDLTFNFQPGFIYNFDQDFSLSGFYKFTSVEDRQDNTTRERNLIYFMLKKEF